MPMEESFLRGTKSTRRSSEAKWSFPMLVFSGSCPTSDVSVEVLVVTVGTKWSRGVAMGTGMICGAREMPLARLLAREIGRAHV